jgi:hypothetical protein
LLNAKSSNIPEMRLNPDFSADCLIAHAATGKGWFVFTFLKNFQFFKKVKTNLSRGFTPFEI